MRFTTIFGAVALALIAMPVAAQGDDADRSALQRALASVNEGDEEFDRPSEAKPGFFGRGFTVTGGEAQAGVASERFGIRSGDKLDKDRVESFRVIKR